MLALRKWTHAHGDASIAARVTEGERLLLDRVCRSGGWNYGNSNVLGKELPPYVPTTAIALLALQGRRDQDAVKKSLAYLAAHSLDERSGLSLSLSRIALAVFGHVGHVEPGLLSRRLSEIDAALAETWETTGYLGNIPAIALAVYAEAGAEENHAAFRI